MSCAVLRCGAALAALGMSAAMAAGDPALTTVRVASGFARPLFVTHAPGDTSRLFVVEQRGRIKIVRDGVVTGTFIDLSGVVSPTGNERGLLGMAFHPDFASNGFFYVDFTARVGGATNIVRYSVDPGNPDQALPASAHPIISYAQPFSNHNGGWVGFGPNDGFLYIANGDGGSGCDPGQRAQDITDQRLGKILRLDVNGDDFPADSSRNYAIPPSNPFVGLAGDDEIWAYGVRNPFRPSFDRQTGDLYIADVGQDRIEELDFQPADSPGGVNYGWDCMEGTQCSSISGCSLVGTCACGDPSLTLPIHEYTHSGPGGFNCAITGGYAYRGCAIPGLAGTYFFADFCSNRIWSLRVVDGAATDITERTAELAPGGGLAIGSITSFGEDANGEIYIVDQGGEIFKIIRACPADMDGDGDADVGDFFAFVAAFASDVCSADLNDDGQINVVDFFAFVAAFAAGCP